MAKPKSKLERAAKAAAAKLKKAEATAKKAAKAPILTYVVISKFLLMYQCSDTQHSR